MRVNNRTRGVELVGSGWMATSLLARLRGLIGRLELQAGQGLIIRPCNAIHTFGLAYPVDAAFLDSRGRVIKVASRIPPNRIGPVAIRASQVLELPSGTIASSGMAVNDELEIVASPDETVILPYQSAC